MTDTLIVPADQAWIVGTPISGVAASVDLSNNLTAPLVYTAANLPDGISMSTSGVFSGTPTIVQRASPIIVTLTDAVGTIERDGFEVIVLSSAADAADFLTGPHIDYQLPGCSVGSPIPNTPTVTSLVTGAMASQAAIYP